MAYYTHATGLPLNQTKALASQIRAELDSIVASFATQPSAIALAGGSSNYAVDSGAANAYVVSVGSAIISYFDGLSLSVKTANANTTASTINVNSLGLKSIVRVSGSALQAGDIVAGQIFQISYSTTSGAFQLDASGSAVSATAAAASAAASSASASTATTQAATATTQAGIATTQAGLSAASATQASVYSAALVGASATSVAIATGSKSFTVSTGKQWSAGQFLTISSSATPANLMHGQVTSYDGTSGALVMNITDTGGSGTASDWIINVAGTQGPAGSTGVGVFVRVTGTSQTAVAFSHYFLQNVALSTLTLPASASGGDIVVATFENALKTNVIARNGLKIMGLSEDLTVNSAVQTVRLRYDDAANGWRII